MSVGKERENKYRDGREQKKIPPFFKGSVYVVGGAAGVIILTLVLTAGFSLVTFDPDSQAALIGLQILLPMAEFLVYLVWYRMKKDRTNVRAYKGTVFWWITPLILLALAAIFLAAFWIPYSLGFVGLSILVTAVTGAFAFFTCRPF